MATKLKVNVRYGVTPNHILWSTTLSLKAKGLFGYIQSKPDGWDFSADRIAIECKEERKTIQGIMRELEKEGFLIRKKNKDALGKWYWEHQLTDSPVVRKADSGLNHEDTEHPEVAFPPTVNPPINKERLTKKEDTLSPSGDEGDSQGEENTETPASFSSKEWTESLIKSPQPHIRLIGYYFGKYSNHIFPNKVVATEEMAKNLKPAVWLVSNFSKDEISKTLKYCEANFSDVHWNLATVKKQITYVIAKDN